MMNKHVLRVTGRPEVMEAFDVSISMRPAPPLPFSIETGRLCVLATDALDEVRSGLGRDRFAHLVRLNRFACAFVFADPRGETLRLAGGAFLARMGADASKTIADVFTAAADVTMPRDFEALDASVERMLRELAPLVDRARGERAFLTARDEEIDESVLFTPLLYGYREETIEQTLRDFVRVAAASEQGGSIAIYGEPPYCRDVLPLDLGIAVARFLDTVAPQGITVPNRLPTVARANRNYEVGRLWCTRRPVRLVVVSGEQTALERARSYRRLADLAQRFETLEPALARAITTLLTAAG